MTAIWGLLAQLTMISIAYPAACLAGATFASLTILGFDPTTIPESSWPQIVAFALFALSLAWQAIISAFWPTLVAVVVTEGLKVRSLIPYLIAGCIVGLVHMLPFGAAMDGEPLTVETAAAQLSVASAAIGGFVYWLIAGHSAGRWLEMPWFEERRWR